MNDNENLTFDENPAMQGDERSAVDMENDPVAALQAEVERLKNENLKLLAETRNVHLRTRREYEERLKYAAADFAKDLLILLDDLGRMVEAAGQNTDRDSLAKSVTLLAEEFAKFLRNNGIERIAAEGQPFDPAVHEALLHQPSADVPAGHVLQEISSGYRLQDRVIRPARVVVSSGAA